MYDAAMSFDDICDAHTCLREVVHRTPVLTSKTANTLTGAQLFFKCENFQRTGAFKFRGAYNALFRLPPAQRAKGVLAYSGGNHAQGIALAAALLGIDATIIMPSDAPLAKLRATQEYGAKVITYDRRSEDREDIGGRLAWERGLTPIASFDHAHIMAGQGTVAKELIEETGPLDMLIVPLGGGGLLSGSAIAVKAMDPGCRIIGVEPAEGNDGQRSLQSGAIVHIDPPDTIADGARTQHLGQHTFPVIKELVSTILTVTDAELIQAMRFFASRMKMIIEPTGCLAPAAAFGENLDLRGKRVGLILSGGNIDLDRFVEWV